MSPSNNDVSLEERQRRLQELQEFTGNCRKQLEKVFEALGWSLLHTQEVMEPCPHDGGHRVSFRNMEKHKLCCGLKKMGYSAEEQAEMVDPSVCYQNSRVRSFVLDKSTQQQVILQARSAAPMMKMEGVFWQGQFSSQSVEVPQNHKRAVCDLTVADRLALYDHVVNVLSQKKEAPSSSTDDLYVDLVSKLQKGMEQQEPKTHLELMAEMRDYKRRRQSYRAKNVHITKKSYTEVIREVISVHSEELSRQWREEEKEKEKEEESVTSEPSSHRRKRRSSSSESEVSHRRLSRNRDECKDRERRKKRKKRDRDSCSPRDSQREVKRKKKKKKKEKEEKKRDEESEMKQEDEEEEEN